MNLTTLILRHRKENLKKCSLRGLETVKSFKFFSYPLKCELPNLSEYILLEVNAEELSIADKGKGIFLLDSTWRYVERMKNTLPKEIETRSIPKGFVTAYPRKQDVETGLASIEALYIAHLITGKSTEGMLDLYYWKDDFLKKNKTLLDKYQRLSEQE